MKPTTSLLAVLMCLILTACGGGGKGGSRPTIDEEPRPPVVEPEPEPENPATPPLDPPFTSCQADPCNAEDLAAIRRHNDQAIRLVKAEDAVRLERPQQTHTDAQQNSVVVYDQVTDYEVIYGEGGASRDPAPQHDRGVLTAGTREGHPYPAPDLTGIGTLPYRFNRLNGGLETIREGRVFTPTATTTRDGATIQYGPDDGYPGIETVRRYLEGATRYVEIGSADRINHQAVVRMREGSTAEELNHTVRAIQTINAALPFESRITMAAGDAKPNEDPAHQEIIVTFAPINEWRGWEDIGPSSVTGVAQVGRSEIGVEVWVNAPVVEQTGKAEGTVLHELLHAIGLWWHVESGLESIINEGGGSTGAVLYEADRAGILAAFTDPTDLGGWAEEALQLHARMPVGDGSIDFGVTYRNGHADAWALGESPTTTLADNPTLLGTATWLGSLIGFTPHAEVVAGDAKIAVNLADLTGSADFMQLESWRAHEAPGTRGSGATWNAGTLSYQIAVEGNSFQQIGGDEGYLTGAFVGGSHEGATGILERADLTGAFGAVRE